MRIPKGIDPIAKTVLWAAFAAFSITLMPVKAADASLHWIANTPSLVGYTLYYGTSAGTYSAMLKGGAQTSATIPGLDENNRYYFVIRAYNSDGESGDSNEVYTLKAINVKARSVTAPSATISWTTDEVSDSQVECGTSTGYGFNSGLDSNLATRHTIALGGLSPSTTYHYRVKSKDASGDANLLVDYAFVTAAATEAMSPEISRVASQDINSRGATIRWITNTTSDSQVEFGPTASYGNSMPLDRTLATSHAISLSGLDSGTLYHYRVKSKDALGNWSGSSDFTFRTLLSAPNSVSYEAGH